MEAAAVRRVTGEFEGAGGVKLFRRSWLPEGEACAAVALVHGYAEHSGRYDWAATRLAEAGYAVHGYDLRGHGQSDGPRVLVRSFNQHLGDLDRLLSLVRTEQGSAPFLFGHSMGGTIVALSLVNRQPEVRGAILSGPGLVGPRGGLRLMARLFALIGRVRPTMGVRRLAASGVSHDPQVVAAYEADPLNYHGKIPAGTLRAMLRATGRIQARMQTIDVPLLLLHGSADELTSPEGSRQLYARASSKDKTLKLYDGLAHEVLNEPEKEQVLADLLAWLGAH